jgi:hypothetical protein
MFLFMDDDRTQPRRLPAGFNEVSYEAVRRAVLIARQQGRDEARAARDVALGLHPALPWPLILDAAEEAQWRR